MIRALGSFDPRSNNFNFLRFFLATAVIFGHCLGGNGEELVIPVVHMPLTPGFHAVNCFFTISGFLICGSWLNSRGLGDYTAKRFLRIYPGMTLALLLCVFLVGPFGGADLATYFRNPQTYRFFAPLILGPTGMLPGVFQHGAWKGSVDGPLWTLRFEIGCYIMLAVLGLMGLIRKPKVLLGIFIASLIVFSLQAMGHVPGLHNPLKSDTVPDQIPRFVTFFLAGMVFYVFRDRIPLSTAGLAISLLTVIVLHSKAMPLVMSVFGSYLLFYFAFSPSIKLNWFGSWGDYSYGMYIYAFPIQQLISYHVGHQLPTAILFPVVFLLTVPVAAASWHFVEKPCLQLKPKKKAAAPLAELPPMAQTAPARSE